MNYNVLRCTLKHYWYTITFYSLILFQTLGDWSVSNDEKFIDEKVKSQRLFHVHFKLLIIIQIILGFFCKAMSCSIGQEPDPESHNRYRWLIPVEDPCQCTQIQLGGVNTRTPCRPFNVTYYDTFLLSNNTQEIQQWLNCSGTNVS